MPLLPTQREPYLGMYKYSPLVPSSFLGFALMGAMMSATRISTLLLCLGAVTVAPVIAQTTPTERAAARDIIQQIDALQER